MPHKGQEGTARGQERAVRYARRQRIERGLEKVNVLIEVADARAPVASRSPVLSQGRFRGKARLVALARRDLADRTLTAQWLETIGPHAAACDARSGRGVDDLVAQLRRLHPQGEVRAMVVGLPNLGKSSLVNRLAGGARAATGNRPGVTVGEQWVRARPWLRLMDEPGVLPGGSSPLLAALGCIPEGEYDPMEAFSALWDCPGIAELVSGRYPQASAVEGPEAALAGVAEGLGARIRGGGRDLERAARQVLAMFRDGRLGVITLERPQGPGEPEGDLPVGEPQG